MQFLCLDGSVLTSSRQESAFCSPGQPVQHFHTPEGGLASPEIREEEAEGEISTWGGYTMRASLVQGAILLSGSLSAAGGSAQRALVADLSSSHSAFWQVRSGDGRSDRLRRWNM